MAMINGGKFSKGRNAERTGRVQENRSHAEHGNEKKETGLYQKHIEELEWNSAHDK